MQQPGSELKAENVTGSKNAGGRSRVDHKGVLGIYLLTCFLSYFFKTKHLISLWALRALDDVELDFIAFFQALITFALDGAVVNEDVRPAFAAQETIALCIVEPLYGAFILCQGNNSLISYLKRRIPPSESASTVLMLKEL